MPAFEPCELLTTSGTPWTLAPSYCLFCPRHQPPDSHSSAPHCKAPAFMKDNLWFGLEVSQPLVLPLSALFSTMALSKHKKDQVSPLLMALQCSPGSRHGPPSPDDPSRLPPSHTWHHSPPIYHSVLTIKFSKFLKYMTLYSPLEPPGHLLLHTASSAQGTSLLTPIPQPLIAKLLLLWKTTYDLV